MAARPALLLLLACLLVLPGLARAQDEDAERLRIHGSNVLGARLVPKLVDAWLAGIGYEHISHRRMGRSRVEIRAVRDDMPLIVEIDRRGTASGLADLAEGNAEIAMSSRQPNARELDAAWQLGDLRSSGQEWVVGLDGLAVLVAPGNPVSEISMAQLRDVLSGKITDWRQLGGPAGPIRVHAMDPRSGTGELTASLVLRGGGLSPGVHAYRDSAQLVAGVRADTAAIGLVAFRVPHPELKALAVRSGALASTPGRVQSATEDYALQRRVYFHTGQLITALGRGFVEFAISPAGQAIVEHSALLPLSLKASAPDSLGQAPEEYRTLVKNARRLPMTVRFSHVGLDLLDSRGRQDVDRLASFLAQPRNAGRQVLLLGFANPDSRVPMSAISLSQERVDYLSAELLALGLRVASVRGFGGSRSLVEAGDPAADYRNTRVEVWLR